MSDYIGQPPHGGNKITHSEHCLGDCGHWDCMGCCGCPPDQVDIDMIEMLKDQSQGRQWIAEWFADQLEQARHDFHTDRTMFTSVVVLGYPGKEISIHGPFDITSGHADRFAQWIRDNGTPASIFNVMSVMSGTIQLIKLHAEKKEKS